MIEPGDIIVITADYYKQPIDRVLSTSRKEELVRVRQVSMYFMRQYIPKIILDAIGTYFPGKVGYVKHCTVLHAIKKVEGYLETDFKFKLEVLSLDKTIAEHANQLSVFEHIETEEEKYNRLLVEKEQIFITEVKHLKEEITALKNENSKLQGKIYGLKLNKKKLRKRKPVIVKMPITDNPFVETSVNNKGYHGYREHSL